MSLHANVSELRDINCEKTAYKCVSVRHIINILHAVCIYVFLTSDIQHMTILTQPAHIYIPTYILLIIFSTFLTNLTSNIY